jgi:glycosyltransferase involved in cell wall biosynthesis
MEATVSKANADQLNCPEWIQAFREKHGRPPRVLHIGNIANNAYNNAKLLNRAGLDCDVLCYNYYHIMGCPEWEDADFEGVIEDQFFPNWRNVNLNGFKRPKWFVQGPLRLCISYLIAKRDGKRFRAPFLWNVLTILNYVICSRKGVFLRKCLRSARNSLFSSRSRWFTIKGLFFYLFMTVFLPIAFLLSFLFVLLVLPVRIFKRCFPQFHNDHTGRYNFDERVHELMEIFEQRFPGREDKLTAGDLLSYKGIIPLLKELFSRYDIIQGYSTDPILPLLAEIPYFAFEHGTLREIPLHQTPQGRSTALSYHLAQHVFVTNSDCLKNAHMLADKRVSFINHPYDEDHGLNVGGWREERERLCEMLDEEFLFFYPTRHDWIPGTGYADKANDVFLNAFCMLRKEGYRVGLVCCQWGSNVKESKDLLNSKGCRNCVYWDEPMGIINFERTTKACHVAIDQFKLGSFGGVMFKAMAVGSPVCTYLDEDEMRSKYGEVPPVINCRTEHDIFAKMKKVMDNPATLKDLSDASRKWIKKHYNSSETVRIQIQRYREFIENHNRNKKELHSL